MADIQDLIDRKERLQKKINEEKKNEYQKFGRWFFNKLNVNKSSEAKKIVKKYLLEEDQSNSENLKETNSSNNNLEEENYL